jgi:hypothetical protein
MVGTLHSVDSSCQLNVFHSILTEDPQASLRS